jgi:hypothetical protein
LAGDSQAVKIYIASFGTVPGTYALFAAFPTSVPPDGFGNNIWCRISYRLNFL